MSPCPAPIAPRPGPPRWRRCPRRPGDRTALRGCPSPGCRTGDGWGPRSPPPVRSRRNPQYPVRSPRQSIPSETALSRNLEHSLHQAADDALWRVDRSVGSGGTCPRPGPSRRSSPAVLVPPRSRPITAKTPSFPTACTPALRSDILFISPALEGEQPRSGTRPGGRMTG